MVIGFASTWKEFCGWEELSHSGISPEKKAGICSEVSENLEIISLLTIREAYPFWAPSMNLIVWLLFPHIGFKYLFTLSCQSSCLVCKIQQTDLIDSAWQNQLAWRLGWWALLLPVHNVWAKWPRLTVLGFLCLQCSDDRLVPTSSRSCERKVTN